MCNVRGKEVKSMLDGLHLVPELPRLALLPRIDPPNLLEALSLTNLSKMYDCETCTTTFRYQKECDQHMDDYGH